MSGLIDAVKADLLDRRMRIVVIAVLVALVGAIGYAVTSGGGESTSPTASTGPGATGSGQAPPLAQQSASNPKGASAETTYGTTYQHAPHIGDPFITLPSTEKKTTTSSTSSASAAAASGGSGSSTASSPKSSSSTSSESSSSHSSSGSSGGSGSSTPKPAPPKKPKNPASPYRVTVELGPAPANTTEPPQMTTYKEVKVGRSLPSSSHPLVTLKGAALASSGAKESGTATFALVSSPIVTGPGICLPTETQCESVRLTTGQLEELQFTEANGQTVTYLMKVTQVVKATQ